jgi:hypothetical protein
MAELIEKHPETNFEDLHSDNQLRLIHNIFPEGTTLLKMLAKTDN